MEAWLRRTFEHGIGAPPRIGLRGFRGGPNEWARVAFEASQVNAAPAIRSGFAKLFEVTLHHEYHNVTSDRRCPDFDIFPNQRTAALMRSLGMLFRDDGTGFSVLYDVERLDRLAHFVDRDRTGAAGSPERWTHLSFLLAPNLGRMVNVTDMAIQADWMHHSLFFQNDDVTVCDFDPTAPIGTKQLMRVKASRFRVELPDDGSATVANVAKTPTLVVDLANPDNNLGVPELGPPVYLDLSGHDEGFYTLTVRDAQGKVKRRESLLYTLTSPAPLCYVHILLCRPKARMPGVYPLDLRTSGGEPKATVTPITFRLRFGARSTRWAYYVIPELALSKFGSLSVTGASAPSSFAPWERVTLPNGRAVARIVSTEPLPTQQRSEVRLQLRGKVSGAQERVLIDRLPVVSEKNVPHEENGHLVSDIYVHL